MLGWRMLEVRRVWSPSASRLWLNFHWTRASTSDKEFQWIREVQINSSNLCFVGSLADLILCIFCVTVFYEWEISFRIFQPCSAFDVIIKASPRCRNNKYLFIFTVIWWVMFQHAALLPLDPGIISILLHREELLHVRFAIVCFNRRVFLAVVQHNVLL